MTTQFVIRADKIPVSQHKRQFNAPTIDEVAIVIVGEEFESRDIILHAEVVTFSESPKLIAHRTDCSIQFCFWEAMMDIILTSK